MIKFRKGKTYSMRSICDYDCVWNITIICRTAKTVTLKGDGLQGVKRCRISEWEGVEQCRPLGNYSMAPALNADREVES